MLMEALQSRLISLNSYEIIGKKHFLQYGQNIRERQLAYLMIYGDNVTSADALYAPEAMKEQERILKRIKSSKPGTLSSSDYFAEERNVEIQQLLRYVDITPHQHDFIEFAYVVTGKCIHRINEREYLQQTGSFVAIPQGYTHVLFPDEDCLCLTMKVRYTTFHDLNFPGWASFILPLAFSCGQDAFVRNTIAAIWLQQEKDLPYCGQITEQLFHTLMYYIEQNFRDDMQYLVTDAQQDPVMVEILGYMADNYQAITLQSVADHFHYSPAYLSRMIHIRTGRTFSDLLKEYKLRQAARLLISGKHKLDQVCEAVGYKDTAQFIHSFKVLYGTTPGQYRKQRQI